MTDRGAFEEEFNRVFEAQFAGLYRYLDRLSGDADLAADLAQEAFVRLYQRGSLPDDVRGWLGAVATNLLRDERRRAGRRRLLLARQPADLTLGAPPPAPDAAAIGADQRAAVRDTLDRMPERDRQLLLLRHEGFSYREVGQALGIAETSVGTLLLRATAAFRAAFLQRHRAPD